MNRPNTQTFPQANRYCQHVVAKSGSSFYYGFLWLNRTQRQAMNAVYAFCREVDDIVDECSEPELAIKKLDWWQLEIGRSFKQQAEHPVGLALSQSIQNFDLSQVLFDEMLQGMRMDLQYQGYDTYADLSVYCHCVASTVGLMIIKILGYEDSGTEIFARKLGLCFQMINIIRDVGEDARRGRVYLPVEDLQQFGLTAEAILDRQPSGDFLKLMQFQTTRARSLFDEAMAALSHRDRGNMLPALIMARIYLSLLDEIELSQFAVLEQRIKLTPLRKIWLAGRTYWQERRFSKQGPIK